MIQAKSVKTTQIIEWGTCDFQPSGVQKSSQFDKKSVALSMIHSAAWCFRINDDDFKLAADDLELVFKKNFDRLDVATRKVWKIMRQYCRFCVWISQNTHTTTTKSVGACPHTSSGWSVCIFDIHTQNRQYCLYSELEKLQKFSSHILQHADYHFFHLDFRWYWSPGFEIGKLKTRALYCISDV